MIARIHFAAAMEQYISELDSSRFGFTVAKLNRIVGDPAALVERLRAAGVRLVIARIGASEIDAVNRLEDLGFRLKDVQVTNRFDLTRNPPPRPPAASGVVRDLEQQDVEQVVALAADSFTGYGHYAADDRLDQARCREAYADWARRSCKDTQIADKILVSVEDGIVRGFLTFKIFEQGGQRYAAGGLGAVARGHRGQGVFSSIVIHGLVWGASAGLAWEEHNALVTNYAVNRVFARLGFLVVDAAVTLHAWL